MRSWQAGLVLMLCLYNAAPAASAEPLAPRIAIIIDDLGYRRSLGERAIDLPGPLTYAVLPGTPSGVYLADRAHQAGKEVLLHLPLQAQTPPPGEEPGSLVLDMSRAQFRDVLADNIVSVPHIAGINTHRGSLLTRHPGHMRWLMDELLERGGLYFVDSYTTAESIALQVARENGVPSARRDVFLDPDPSAATVAREFERLKTIARQRGFAIGIGHPYPETLAFLEAAIPGLAADGYVLTSVGDLISGDPVSGRDAAIASGQ